MRPRFGIFWREVLGGNSTREVMPWCATRSRSRGSLSSFGILRRSYEQAPPTVLSKLRQLLRFPPTPRDIRFVPPTYTYVSRDSENFIGTGGGGGAVSTNFIPEVPPRLDLNRCADDFVSIRTTRTRSAAFSDSILAIADRSLRRNWAGEILFDDRHRR